MDTNIDNEENDGQQQADEQELLLKLISILEWKVTYPAQTIERIDHLVVEFLEGLDRQLQSDSEDEDEDDRDRVRRQALTKKERIAAGLDRQLKSEDEVGDEGWDEDDRDRDQAFTEEERIAADAATAGRSRLMLLKLISIAERKVTHTAHTTERIDGLVDYFLENLEGDVCDMFCSNDLDSSRDTEAEVEAIVRVFPNILSETVAVQIRGELCRFYPIQFLAFTVDDKDGIWVINEKTVSFVPIVARLAIEFGSFEEEERGGLLLFNVDYFFECDSKCSVDSVLQGLTNSVTHSDPSKASDQHHNEFVDGKYLLVMEQLRQNGLLKKGDIQTYGLLNELCIQDVTAEKRLQFLVEWDPTVLTHTNTLRCIPLHIVAMYSIVRFRLVFEYGIRYYPHKKGICLLFRKDDDDDTPFQLACGKFGYKEVMKGIEDTLARYSDTPINISEALVMSAIDEDIHLDCVYFLLRREPDVLVKLLSPSSSLSSTLAAGAVVAVGTNGNDINNNNGDSKKRKRT
ncbi:hypothetical protein FRACYDRAFT_241395 [Fragilariopsis cylindrus CCMP1102]|uniref:Uncharacterized protein n=1 Tax=Fragilariopsis cylindrus CCMP1102 TaxID=635003 RepID=A0A1E7F9J6_9STRA|nr:hypothetical protein FRACYDRAFT_241395 [Fragilariopsis cylindrus CCMP1102]|eukprot:OEU14838.1 hypothetical protein FRACYDRAFT_241395 [Fragilariopsis cylindrus CCMP1102]